MKKKQKKAEVKTAAQRYVCMKDKSHNWTIENSQVLNMQGNVSTLWKPRETSRNVFLRDLI
jgi:hypothetical protein